jgi:hypothetical protein
MKEGRLFVLSCWDISQNHNALDEYLHVHWSDVQEVDLQYISYWIFNKNLLANSIKWKLVFGNVIQLANNLQKIIFNRNFLHFLYGEKIQPGSSSLYVCFEAFDFGCLRHLRFRIIVLSSTWPSLLSMSLTLPYSSLNYIVASLTIAWIQIVNKNLRFCVPFSWFGWNAMDYNGISSNLCHVL